MPYPIKTALGLLLGLFIICSSSVAQSSEIRELENGALLLENFEDQKINELPFGWYDRDGNKPLHKHDRQDLIAYKYRVRQENGNKFLHYEGTSARHINYPLINKEGVNIYETPILSWKVRAHTLPKNANEDKKSRNDAVASIYVVFDFGHVLFKKVPKSIRYTWSTTLPEGTELSKFFGNQKIVVVESGKSKTGRWVTFQRNIVEDYKRLFGDDPPETPLAILILSDGDSTGNFAEADYDDIMLLPGKNDK